MRTLIVVIGLVVGGGLAVDIAVAAVPLDGSSPLLCAVTEVQECQPGAACRRRTPEQVNLPPFLRFDPRAKRLVTGDGSGRAAAIHEITQVDGRLLMNGGQEGRSWSAAIQGDTGRLSVGVVDQEVGFVVFGACTTP